MSNEISSPAGQGSDSEAVRVLRAARGRLESKGWAQGGAALGSHECAGIAIDRASLETPLGRDAAFALFRRAAQYTGSVVDWNDKPERTQAEVLDAFDKAIALASGASVPERHPQ